MISALETFVKTAESSGMDIDVTLIVDGVIMTGSITSSARWHRWAVECLHRSEFGGSGFTIPPEAPEITIEQRQAMAEEFKAEFPNPDEWQPAGFSLANAIICTGHGPGRQWMQFPFLRVAASSVSAVAIGKLQPETGGR